MSAKILRSAVKNLFTAVRIVSHPRLLLPLHPQPNEDAHLLEAHLTEEPKIFIPPAPPQSHITLQEEQSSFRAYSSSYSSSFPQSSSFSGSFGSFSGSFAGSFGSFSSSFAGSFGSYLGSFAGSYSSSFPGSFGSFSGSFADMPLWMMPESNDAPAPAPVETPHDARSPVPVPSRRGWTWDSTVCGYGLDLI